MIERTALPARGVVDDVLAGVHGVRPGDQGATGVVRFSLCGAEPTTLHRHRS